MKIKSNTSYPYPIWGWKDDYTSTIKDEDIVITEISNKDNFVYELELLAENDDIETLIANGSAFHACIGYCPSTFRQFCFYSNERKFQISIPRREVNETIKFNWMILTKDVITEFESSLLNSDYDGCASFPFGAMIGYITSFEINTTISDELRSLDEIFVVVKNTESNDIVYDLDNRKIRIKLPENQLKTFNNYGGKYPAIMHSTIVLQALILAISRLQDYEDTKDWVYILKQYIDTMDSEQIPPFEDIEDEGYNVEQCFEIANYILDKPIMRMLSDIEIIEQQTEQQSIS